MHYLMAWLATGTRSRYEAAWKQWSLFCRAHARDPYLLSKNVATRRCDEEALLDYIVHPAKYFKRTEGSVKLKLIDVRCHHLTLGLEDSFLHKARLWVALAGIKRLGGPTKRKFPVTDAMLDWLRVRFEDGTADSTVAWAAIATGWLFLLRTGEFVGVNVSPWQLERVVTGSGVQPRRGGLLVANFADVDETIVRIKGSKTDQYNEGTTRNQYGSGQAVDHIKAL